MRGQPVNNRPRTHACVRPRMQRTVPLISGHQRPATADDSRPRIIRRQGQDTRAHNSWPSPKPPGTTVKPRVLWRLVYLDVVVAGCGCSWRWVSGARAASCSAGVRMPMAEWGRVVLVPVDPLGGGELGRRRCPPRGPGQRMGPALYKEFSASARAKPKGGLPWIPPRRPPRSRPEPAHSGWLGTARRGRSGAPGPSGRRPRAGAAR